MKSDEQEQDWFFTAVITQPDPKKFLPIEFGSTTLKINGMDITPWVHSASIFTEAASYTTIELSLNRVEVNHARP